MGETTTASAAVSGSVQFAGSPVHVFVDSGSTVAETDESNNYAQSGPPCETAPGPRPFRVMKEGRLVALAQGATVLAHALRDPDAVLLDEVALPAAALHGLERGEGRRLTPPDECPRRRAPAGSPPRGAQLADAILRRLHFTDEAIGAVQHLIRKHLSMYLVATRRDLDDPRTLEGFVEAVQGTQGLRELYLLTIADVATTSPAALNPWKQRMLDELFHATLYWFKQGDTRRGATEQIAEEDEEEHIPQVGQEPVGSVPADGRPVLAFYEPIRGEVIVAKCANARCEGRLSGRAVSGPGRFGAGLALAIGANGQPLLSYQDVSARTLRVAGNAMDDAIIRYVRRQHQLIEAEQAIIRVDQPALQLEQLAPQPGQRPGERGCQP